jgi:hypothetical protein
MPASLTSLVSPTSSKIFRSSSSSTILPAVGWLMPSDPASPAREETPTFWSCRIKARLFKRPMREGEKII